MRKIVGLAIVVGLGLLAPALAGTPKGEPAPTASPNGLVTKADAMGYDVQSVREHHGRVHADLLDRETGRTVHAEFSAGDGELMSARIAKDDDRNVRNRGNDEGSREARKRHGRDGDRD
jgi:hypothetical protein